MTIDRLTEDYKKYESEEDSSFYRRIGRVVEIAGIVACLAFSFTAEGCKGKKEIKANQPDKELKAEKKDSVSEDKIYAAIDKSEFVDKVKLHIKDIYRVPKEAYTKLHPDAKECVDTLEKRLPYETKDMMEEFKMKFPWVNFEKMGLADRILIVEYKVSRNMPSY